MGCIYRDHGLTTYNWLSREKNRHTIMSCCSFLSINATKIKSCRLVEKRRTKVLYVDFSSTLFRFKAKTKPSLVKTKDGSGSGHAHSFLPEILKMIGTHHCAIRQERSRNSNIRF
jgi:hypothetical protein